MARLHYIQTNFTGGEISPRLRTRTDIQRYNNSCETLENFIISPQGGAHTRPGLEYIGETEDSSARSRLIPFEFNVTQTYALEFGNLYIKPFSQGGRVVESPLSVLSAVNNGSGLIQLEVAGHGYSNGDQVFITGVTGTTEANGVWYIANVTTNTFDLVGSVFINPYIAGGTSQRVVNITTPYTTVDVAALRYAQDADILYLVSSAFAVRQLERSSATTFTLNTTTFTGGPFVSLDHPQYSGIGTGITMTIGATTGSTTLTASSAFFTTSMVGMLIRLGGRTGSPDKQGYALINSFTSATVVNVTVQHAISGTVLGDAWALGAWGEETGYPTDVTFFQQRLWFAGTAAEPSTVWGSATGTSTDMSVGTNDDDAVQFTVASNQANVIRWLSAQKDLLLGTSARVFSMTGGGDGNAITPSNVLVTPEAKKGSKFIRPLQILNSAVFVNRPGTELLEAIFDFSTESYEPSDLSLLAEHIIANDPITEMAYQEERDSTIWLVLESGLLVSVTWLKSQEVLAWSRHPMTNGQVESVITLPSATEVNDQVWMIVKRTINGQTKRYVELLNPQLDVDSGLIGVVNSRTITGLGHLEGETVRIIGDGAQYNDRVVSDGTVTVANTEPIITTAKVGLPYTPTLTTVEPELQLANGTSLGREGKRWVKVKVRVLNTAGLTINGNMTESRSTEDLMDEVPAVPVQQDLEVRNLQTGPGELGENAKLTLTQTQSLPATILGVFGEVEVGDG